MIWSNAAQKVYHGTIDTHLSTIQAGINPSVGRSAADFGRGFYVTTVLHQAEQWANQKARNEPLSRPRAAVILFDLDRDKIDALGDHLTFVLADADFYAFVRFNRFGSSSHGRNSGCPYDVVYGPVAVHPQSIVLANCDQICFVAGGKNANLAVGALAFAGVTYGNPYF